MTFDSLRYIPSTQSREVALRWTRSNTVFECTCVYHALGVGVLVDQSTTAVSGGLPVVHVAVMIYETCSAYRIMCSRPHFEPSRHWRQSAAQDSTSIVLLTGPNHFTGILTPRFQIEWISTAVSFHNLEKSIRRVALFSTLFNPPYRFFPCCFAHWSFSTTSSRSIKAP